MRCLAGALLITFLLCNPALAGELSLADITWSLAAGSSSTYYVEILNEDGVTDHLSSWQLSLVLYPVEDATGVVQFDSADIPRLPSENYLLEGISAVLAGDPPSPLVSGPTDNILLGDYAMNVIGKEVPSSGKTLLKLDLSASEDAVGVYAIAAVTGGVSFWGSVITNDYGEIIGAETSGFADIPLDSGDPVVIGHVIIVPEPHGLLLLSIVAVAWGFGCRIGRNQGRG